MALPAHLALEIVTPDRAIVHDQVDEVQVPGSEGYFGVLPGHTPLLSMLQVGQLWYRKGAEKFYLSVAFGLAEVLPDRVVILAQIAERAEEIDVDRAQAARQRAEQRLASRQRDQDLERARVALMKALTRLNVATRARTRG
jgi:F-type H+-transporting ATPase subunit epsilon